MLLRFDLVFSYWIFIWYLVYFFKDGLIYSPKFALLLGIIENIFMLLAMLYFGSNTNTIILFIIINIFIKIIPYISLLQTKINSNDIKATVLLFSIYCIWVFINNESILKYQNKILDSLINNKNETPLIFLLNNLRVNMDETR